MINKIDEVPALIMHFEEHKQVYEQLKQSPTDSNMMGDAYVSVRNLVCTGAVKEGFLE